MFSAYPLALILRLLSADVSTRSNGQSPSATSSPMASVRHLYSLAIGLLLGCWMLGDGMLHPVGVSLVAWVLIRVGAKGWLPANVVSMLVFVWAFGMLGARRQLRQQQHNNNRLH
jgi:hypothetical protein